MSVPGRLAATLRAPRQERTGCWGRRPAKSSLMGVLPWRHGCWQVRVAQARPSLFELVAVVGGSLEPVRSTGPVPIGQAPDFIERQHVTDGCLRVREFARTVIAHQSDRRESKSVPNGTGLRLLRAFDWMPTKRLSSLLVATRSEPRALRTVGMTCQPRRESCQAT